MKFSGLDNLKLWKSSFAILTEASMSYLRFSFKMFPKKNWPILQRKKVMSQNDFYYSAFEGVF